MNLDNLPPIENIGWFSACAPTSPARMNPLDLDSLPASSDLSSPTRRRTFVHDHLRAMDPCAHPSLVRAHGQFIPHAVGPGLPDVPMAPQFSYSASPLHADLRAATPFNWVADLGGKDMAWADKGKTLEGRQGRLLWRGSNTGAYCEAGAPWERSQRQRLVAMAEERAGSVAVMREADLGARESRIWRGRDLGARPRGWDVVQVDRTSMGDEWVDVHFSGSPMQCDEEACKEMEEMFDWRDGMNWEQASRYKYVMDVSVSLIVSFDVKLIVALASRSMATAGRRGSSASSPPTQLS
jgi:hypothetical protein